MSTITCEPRVTPEEGWGLERLGEYCLTASRRMALAAWRVGRALQFAKELHGKHGEWGPWLEQYCFGWSRATITRYMTLARRLTEDQVLDENLTLMDAYRLAGVAVRSVPKADGPSPNVSRGPSPESGPTRALEGRSPPDAGPSPVPASPAGTSPICLDPVSDDLGEPELSPEEGMREHLAYLPKLFAAFWDFFSVLRSHEKPLRDLCWPEANRDSIREACNRLRDELAWLEGDVLAAETGQAA